MYNIHTKSLRNHTEINFATATESNIQNAASTECLLVNPGSLACRALAGMRFFLGSQFVSSVQPSASSAQMRSFPWRPFWLIMNFAPGDCLFKDSPSVLGHSFRVQFFGISQTQSSPLSSRELRRTAEGHTEVSMLH